MPVHNHGPEDAAALNCPETRQADGSLKGACMTPCTTACAPGCSGMHFEEVPVLHSINGGPTTNKGLPEGCPLTAFFDPMDGQIHSDEKSGEEFTVEIHPVGTRAELAAMRSGEVELRDVLRRNGFVECDVPACNCGSWHARFGYPERFKELKEELDEAGFISNANGNNALNGLRELIAEYNRLRAPVPASVVEALRCIENGFDEDHGVIYYDALDAIKRALSTLTNTQNDDTARLNWLEQAGNWPRLHEAIARVESRKRGGEVLPMFTWREVFDEAMNPTLTNGAKE